MEREKLLLWISGSQRVAYRSLIVALVLSAASFFFSKKLLFLLSRSVHIKLYYFTLSEVFFSTVELAIYSGIFLSVPVIAFLMWREFRTVMTQRQMGGYLFLVFFIFLFYLGTVFCYFVVLPSGIGFLISYQGGVIKAMISTERFVRFCTGMMFAFGSAFELPLILLFLGRLGLVSSRKLTRWRRYAVLFIVIAASVITPTPDVYNMSLLAVPLYLLYEVGIVLLKITEKKRARREA